jgi:hypothetical protein
LDVTEGLPMTNIPTDLLRTLIAVVDLRSFTKAAQSLGVTQPAVSAQIRAQRIHFGPHSLQQGCPPRRLIGLSVGGAGPINGLNIVYQASRCETRAAPMLPA